MNTQDFINEISRANANDIEKAGLSKAAVERIVKSVFDTISNAMVNGEEVAIRGFGTFTVVEKAARECRNPQTGEKKMMDAKLAPKIRFAKPLKDAVSDSAK